MSGYYTLLKPLPKISLLVVIIINALGSKALIFSLSLIASIRLHTVCTMVRSKCVYSPTAIC